MGKFLRSFFLFISLFLYCEVVNARHYSGNIHFFETLVVDFPATVIVSQGGVNAYEVEGEQESLDRLKVHVRGGKLIFEKKGKRDPVVEPVKITITARKLLEIKTFGNISLSLMNLTTPKLAVYSDGMAIIDASGLDVVEFSGVFKGNTRFKAQGKIKEQEFDSEGIVDVSFKEVESKITSIKADGRGVYIVNVSDKLWVRLTGEIICNYEGKPKNVDSLLLGNSKLNKM